MKFNLFRKSKQETFWNKKLSIIEINDILVNCLNNPIKISESNAEYINYYQFLYYLHKKLNENIQSR